MSKDKVPAPAKVPRAAAPTNGAGSGRQPDAKKVMIIGSGPIIIGQAAEFDFSGSQAIKSVKEEGYQVVLVNSNPATIQTDPDMADAVYIEPLNPATVEAIIAKERPIGILSGMGGQTALNLCAELGEKGILDKYGVKLMGCQLDAIEDAEDRERFKQKMVAIGEPVPKSRTANTLDEARKVVGEVTGYPAIIRPAFTLGGTGGGIAHSEEELEEICGRGLALSRTHQILIEESVLGWKEFEYEVIRDRDDNCIIICSMENLDPMGVHTGESIVVAPAQTLSDQDNQALRSAAIKIIRSLKIEGGCNVQFAVHPERWEYRVIEVNPRVSRSSALASKATGYPIARVAAKIALGLRLHEIPNDITGETMASFEPTLDYVVTKIPRWPFDKFRTADPHIGTQMKSTGEVMAIGRNIEESLLKAVRSLEVDAVSLDAPKPWTDAEVESILTKPTHQRLFAIAEALKRGWGVAKVAALTAWDPFFLEKVGHVLRIEADLKRQGPTKELLGEAKRHGFADEHLMEIFAKTEEEVRALVDGAGLKAVYKMVDTCAAEFGAKTPYYYSTYELRGGLEDVKDEISTEPSRYTRRTLAAQKPLAKDRKKCVILGSGPIRIGQGIEFDYSCVHASWALREEGIMAIMVNNNPETVSTDYDTSDKLYFEPLTLECVLDVLEEENPDGVLVQFGGQTAINLALPLQEAIARRPHLKTKVWGTLPEAIDLAADRDKFHELMEKMKVPQPQGGTGTSFEEVKAIATRIGYPVLVRPSYVLGGRAMEIAANEEQLERYTREAAKVSKKHPILVDRYLTNATEVDVDAVADGADVLVGAVMEHIEEAGVHSGDSTCTIPPPTLPPAVQTTIEIYTKRIAQALGTKGLINIQYAVKDGKVFVLEANPRSSRTVPFVSKATGVPLAKLASKVCLGQSLRDVKVKCADGTWRTGAQLLAGDRPRLTHWSVKAPCFPFNKLVGVDNVLGPEMKSTGEVMGIDYDLGLAWAKAMLSAGIPLPTEGTVFISVRDDDKEKILPIASQLADLGLSLVATKGTATYLRDFGVPVQTVWKVYEKGNPDALDLLRRGVIKLLINTPSDSFEAPERRDGYMMRRIATELQVPFIANIAAAQAAASAIAAMKRGKVATNSLAEYFAARAPSDASSRPTVAPPGAPRPGARELPPVGRT